MTHSSPQSAATPPVVLVAEDETLTRMMAVDILTDAGFTVIEAGDAEAALTILNSAGGDIRILFTDIQMPGSLDGLDLARHAWRHWPWLALLVTSGRTGPNSDDMPAGSRFLSKPYDPDQLVSVIRELAGAQSPD